jgi:nitroreductase
MDVNEAIRTKHATRNFADRPVSEEDIRRVVNAGRRSQSSKNNQPWDFVVVRDREALKGLSQSGKFAGHLAGAAFAVVLVSPDLTGRASVPFDLGQAAAYMQLAGWELGLGSCIAWLHEGAKAGAILGVPQDKAASIALSFGYPAEGERRPDAVKKGGRKGLEEVVHWEKWDS